MGNAFDPLAIMTDLRTVTGLQMCEGLLMGGLWSGVTPTKTVAHHQVTTESY